MTMGHRYILHLDAHGLQAWQSQTGRMRRIAHWPSDDSGLAAFGQWLQARPRGEYRVIVDLPEEVIVQEQIPSVSGADRRLMIRRRLQQHFPPPVFATALQMPCGRSAVKARSSILLAGLESDANLGPWLDILEQNLARLLAIHSPALLLPALLKAAKLPSGTGLFVSFSRAGQRHTGFDQGRPLFTRLAPANGMETVATPQQCAEEIVRTHQYMQAQRMLEPSARLPVVLLACDPDRAAFAQCLDAVPGIEIRFLSPDPTGRNTGTTDSDSSAFFASLALRARRTPQLAPSPALLPHRIHRACRALTGVALAVSLIAAGLALHDYRKLGNATEMFRHARELATQIRNELDELQASLPEHPSAEDLRKIAGIQTRQSDQLSLRNHGLASLGRALDKHPAVQLLSLEWQHSDETGHRDISFSIRLALPAGNNGELQRLSGTLTRLGFLQPASATPLRALPETPTGTDAFRLDLKMQPGASS